MSVLSKSIHIVNVIPYQMSARHVETLDKLTLKYVQKDRGSRKATKGLKKTKAGREWQSYPTRSLKTLQRQETIVCDDSELQADTAEGPGTGPPSWEAQRAAEGPPRVSEETQTVQRWDRESRPAESERES